MGDSEAPAAMPDIPAHTDEQRLLGDNCRQRGHARCVRRRDFHRQIGELNMFALCDVNSFYASCETVLRPDLRGWPVVVLPNSYGCVIASSTEAKAAELQWGSRSSSKRSCSAVPVLFASVATMSFMRICRTG